LYARITKLERRSKLLDHERMKTEEKKRTLIAEVLSDDEDEEGGMNAF
jgi:hypothetical protein